MLDVAGRKGHFSISESLQNTASVVFKIHVDVLIVASH